MLIGSFFMLMILLLFGIGLFYPERFNSIIAFVYFFIVGVIGLFIFLAGFKLFKKPNKSTTPLPYDYSDIISLKVNLTFKEYIGSNIALLMGGYSLYIFSTFGIILLLNLFSSIYAGNLCSYGIYILIGMGSFFFWLYYIYRKNYYSNRSIQEEITYSISKESIHAKSSSVDSINRWSNIFRAVETKGYFFIYTDSINAYIIPKPSFLDSKEIEALRNVIRSYPFEKKLLK